MESAAGMRELYQVWPSRIEQETVERILAAARSRTAGEGTMFCAAEDLSCVRSCTVRWLEDGWIRSLLWPFAQRAAEGGFRVALDGRCQMQICEYSAHRGDQYGWHHDVRWHSQDDTDRKISITVQLSTPESYTGGDLEFEEVATNADFRSRGTVVLFPSYLRHRIRPVTSGTRRALVAWFSGPRWT